jgi:uncharacterized membrane protein YoaT (DUF817 family)
MLLKTMLKFKKAFRNALFLIVFILVEFLTCKSLEYVVVDSRYDLVVMLCVRFQIENHMSYHLCCTEEFLCA